MAQKENADDCWFYMSETEGDDGVLYLPSWRDCGVYDKKVPDWLDRVSENGLNAFSAPYRGLLNQPGEYNFFSMVDDTVEYVELFKRRAGVENVCVVGNSVGGIPALAATLETNLIDKVVTMNTIFTFSNEDWWHSEEEYKKRILNWEIIKKGKNGSYGTEFNGLDERFYKEKVCNLQHEDSGRISFDERAEELLNIPMLLMVSYKDERVNPLHTWTIYRHLRNAQAKKDAEQHIDIRVVRKEDPNHRLLLNDEGLQDNIINWVNERNGVN